ncbi:helix-turn-helix transcriptional regulator [Oceanobacillus sp. FSL W8-0428]|uniref:helix-turn-helix transcriptional regulator n=1 Tax=Oceanobacillus sp. FSL W8-0428 TaxID=2921715 RepID=UPI0030FCA59A
MSSRQINSLEFQLLAKSSLGDRLKFFRMEVKKLDPNKDYTTTAIAERVGVTPQSISAIERGESKKPSFQLIHKLTKEYGIPLEAATNEFYEEEKLFTIGHPIEVDIDFTDFEIIDDSTPNLGILVYQANSENQIRFVLNEEITHVKDIDFIKLLSRLIYELEFYQMENSIHISELFRKESPFDKSMKLFRATEEIYPYISKKQFSNVIYELTKNKNESE